jgi:GntR family transcriptional regulator
MTASSDSNVPLNRDSPLPLFFQVRERLLTIIARWDRGDERFLTDEEISERYAVSRTTVRQAISALVSEGLLRRIPGNGTFVTARRLEEQLEPGMDIRGQWSSSFLPMEVQVLDFYRAPANAAEAKLLGVSIGAEILHVRRLRKAGGVPIALDERCILGELVQQWTEENARGSMLHQLWEGRPLRTGDLLLEAALGEPEERALLHLMPGAPVMIRTLVYEDMEGRRVMAGRSVHRADLMRYRVRIPLQRSDDPLSTPPQIFAEERAPTMQED